MYHVVFDEEAYYMLFFYYVPAESLTENAKHSGMTVDITFLRQIAAIMAQFIKYDVFLCAEK
jgi:hypothetical protein